MEGALDFAFAMLIPVVLMATQHRPPAELDGLFAQLRASKNATSARVIVERIWECWVHHDAPDIRALMDQGLRDIEQHRYDQALKAFDEILERDPDFAEAWKGKPLSSSVSLRRDASGCLAKPIARLPDAVRITPDEDCTIDK